MFNNIGRKIKTFAKVMCWIGIISSVLTGLVMIAGSFSGRFSGPAAAVGILSGIAVALVGSLISWVGSFMMVGFGELVENSAEIAANTRKNNY